MPDIFIYTIIHIILSSNFAPLHNMKLITTLIPVLLIFVLPGILFAQISPQDVTVDSTQTVGITLTDGSQLTGEILSVSDTELELRQQSGRIYILLNRVQIIQPADSDSPARRWFKNPNTSRLLVSPTARPLEKGDGYYQNVYVFISGVSYGITNNLSVTGGISMIPAIGIKNQLYFVGGRFGGAVKENHYLSGGAVIVSAGGFDNNLLIGFGNYTYAFSRGSLTTGLTGFSVTEETGTTAVLFGGDYRLLQRIAFVSENHYFPDVNETMLSYGLRFMGEQMSFDLAFIQPGFGLGLGIGIPFVDFVFNF